MQGAKDFLAKLAGNKKEFKPFSFENSASDELANLVARAYKIHLACGGEVNEEVEKMVQSQKDRQKEASDVRKLDEFERLKVQIANECKTIDDKIAVKKENPGPEINTQIQALFLALNGKVDRLKDLQFKLANRVGLWNKLKSPPKPEFIEQRDADIRNIVEYIDALKQKNRGGKTIKQEEMKSKDTLDNMDDLSKESGIPGVDISEGVKQIEDNKRKIEEGLGELISQVEKMKEHADNFKSELEKQEKLLDQIEKDVEKYDKKLGTLNKTMDKALAAVGGPLKMVLYIIIGVLIFATIMVIYVIIENSINK